MTWLILLVSLYVIYCGLLFFFQTALIFPASMAGRPSGALPTVDTEVLVLPTEQGETVAWLVPAPRNELDRPAPLAVFFHGNAELIDHQQTIIDLYHDFGVHVLMVEYRGYGQSEGTPSEAHIVADSIALIEDVLERDSVDRERLVLHGRSIGGGLATQVARRTRPSALIVESTFTSVSGMAMRYGIPPFLVTSPLKSQEAFLELDVPILIMHGKHDSIVPVSHARKLKAASRDATLLLFESDHNDLPSAPEANAYRAAIRFLLEKSSVLPS